jgi:hypothetical protein
MMQQELIKALTLVVVAAAAAAQQQQSKHGSLDRFSGVRRADKAHGQQPAGNHG